MMCKHCNFQPAVGNSQYCSRRCSTAAWHEKNKDILAEKKRDYGRERYGLGKKQRAWEARKQQIIEKYGATRQWLRKVEAREVLNDA